ncbi:MAG: hypothetical protein BIFFINMI_03973 [Phycisphaerae bacterium]|nr:hypothetical protein [Phycisphaerae bacterium]
MEANFKADGRCSYRIRGEEGVETGEGAWKVEGDHLKVHTDGGDDVDLPWRLENGQLVLGPADDQTRLARVGPAPATTPDATPPALPPVTPPQPAGNRPNGDRLVGDLPMPSSYTPYRCLDVDNGFKDAAGRPMEVFNMLMPTGWRFAGGVKWILNYKDPRLLTRSELLSPARIAFTVSEPSGRCVLSVYPEERFVDLRGSPAANMGLYPQGSRYAGMIVCDAATPDNYILGWVIPRQRGQTDMANPQVVARKELPQAAALFAKEVEILNRAAGQAAIANVAHRAAMVTVDYDSGGVRWREMFVSVLMYIQTPGCTMWWHRYTISARAPRDEFASWQRYVVTAICSIRFNNAWLVRYLQVTDEAFAKIQDVDEYIRKIDHDIWANREQINLRIHRDMYPLLAPYADYLGADGKTRYLPTGGKYQANRRGEVREGDNLPEHDPEWQPLKLLEPQ